MNYTTEVFWLAANPAIDTDNPKPAKEHAYTNVNGYAKMVCNRNMGLTSYESEPDNVAFDDVAGHPTPVTKNVCKNCMRIFDSMLFKKCNPFIIE